MKDLDLKLYSEWLSKLTFPNRLWICVSEGSISCLFICQSSTGEDVWVWERIMWGEGNKMRDKEDIERNIFLYFILLGFESSLLIRNYLTNFWTWPRGKHFVWFGRYLNLALELTSFSHPITNFKPRCISKL